MEIFIRITQLLLSLSILVLLHEFGHYVAARMFKIRVEKFYLFFNPWFSLFKFKRGETTYGIGWLPLGGYVKIAGMIDESMDKEQMKKEPQSWEFRSKPAWQRLIVMVAGVFMNLVLAVVIYICVLAVYGEQYLPAKNAKFGIAVDSTAYEMGLRDGDHIIMLDGEKTENMAFIPADILLNKTKVITVVRDGQQTDVNVEPDMINLLLKNKNFDFISARIPTVVVELVSGSPAEMAGLLPNDTIVGVNDMEVLYFQDFKKTMAQYADSNITITALRGADTVVLQTTVSSDGTLGFSAQNNFAAFFELETITYSLFSAIPAGFKMTISQSKSYLKQLRIIFSPKTEAYKSLGGFITIGKLFPAKWSWYAFWMMTAFISIILAIMNLLPIPALDGGHVMFLFWELITGRKPNQKVMEYAQVVGMMFLLLLLLYANGSDVFRLFK